MRTDDIEDVYPLSPMQAGMLFHTLYTPERGVYLDQQVFALDGRLDRPAFERAWHHLLHRHSVLRTSFHWDGLEEPLQVVHKSARIHIEFLDWRDAPEADQQERLEAMLREGQSNPMEL